MRLYNGCPDDELKALWDNEEKLLKRLKELNSEAHCTYFPEEGEYQVHEWGKPISGFHKNKFVAISEAICILKVREKNDTKYV